ncbi:MAG: hypothetical protein V1821_02065 [bacterium]
MAVLVHREGETAKHMLRCRSADVAIALRGVSALEAVWSEDGRILGILFGSDFKPAVPVRLSQR